MRAGDSFVKMNKHNEFLKLAVDESLLSVEAGSSPFGAVIVKAGKIIAKAHNTVVPSCDATAHAEVNAIRKAGQSLNTFDLKGCVLYTSCEPCPMCLNAIKWANIKKVYFAATRDDADAIGFRDKVFYEKDGLDMHHIEMEYAKEVMEKWHSKKNRKRY